MKFLNNWSAPLTSALAAGGATLPVSGDDAARLIEGDDYLITITNEARTAWEIVKATRSGATVAIERGLEGTPIASWVAGDLAYVSLTAGTLEQLLAAAPAPVVIGDDVPAAPPPAAGALYMLGGSSGAAPVWIALDNQYTEDWVRIVGQPPEIQWLAGDTAEPRTLDNMTRLVKVVLDPSSTAPIAVAEFQAPDWPVIREDLLVDIMGVSGTGRSVQLDIQFPHAVDGFSIATGASGATAAVGADFLRIVATETVRITLQSLEFYAENPGDPKLVYGNIVVGPVPVEDWQDVSPIDGG